MDVELSVNGLAWDLHLELLGEVGFVEGSAALRAGIRQRCLVDLVDLFGGRWLAVSPGAIILSRLAAWLARMELGLALGKGGGLALASTEGGVELKAESPVLGLQIVNPSLKRLAVGTGDRWHTSIIGKAQAPLCSSAACAILASASPAPPARSFVPPEDHR
jgi:hypothetical protein